MLYYKLLRRIITVFLSIILIGVLTLILLRAKRQGDGPDAMQTAQSIRNLATYKGPEHAPVKAVIVTLCRNSDLRELLPTLRQFEERFNKRFSYPYVFLNNEPFEDGFKIQVSALIEQGSNAKISFGLIPKDHWSYPTWINQKKAEQCRADLGRRGTIYGGSESYRFMCRYFSGFFFRHPLLDEYEYYWRVEPGVQFMCNIDYDVFKMMRSKGKLYGFAIIINEIMETIPSLWMTILGKPEYRSKFDKKDEDSNIIAYFGNPDEKGYNGCHFWSNFEIASLAFLRSKEYLEYFKHLDKAGGFFYERWGDAPVHSIAAGLFLKPDQVHYFEDIGYRHPPFSHCPADLNLRRERQCACNPYNYWEGSRTFCLNRWKRMFGNV